MNTRRRKTNNIKPTMDELEAMYADMFDEYSAPPEYDPMVHGLRVCDLSARWGLDHGATKKKCDAMCASGKWTKVCVWYRRDNGSKGYATAYRPKEKSR